METLEKHSETFDGVKENVNNIKYDVNYILEKQKKRDNRLKEKTEQKAKEMKAKASILWNRMEKRRMHIRQGGINEQ